MPIQTRRIPISLAATAPGRARFAVRALARMPATLSTATTAHAPTTGTTPWPEPWALCSRTSR
eukprot:15432084-Alexandrium_andersonii.AAC.1